MVPHPGSPPAASAAQAAGDAAQGFSRMSPLSLHPLPQPASPRSFQLPILSPLRRHRPHPLSSCGPSFVPSTRQFLPSCLRTSLRNVPSATLAKKSSCGPAPFRPPPPAATPQSSLASPPSAELGPSAPSFLALPRTFLEPFTPLRNDLPDPWLDGLPSPVGPGTEGTFSNGQVDIPLAQHLPVTGHKRGAEGT